METEMIKVNPGALEGQVAIVVKAANALQVASPEAYERGGEGLQHINARTKQVKDFFKEPKAKAHDAHKSITAAEKKLLDPLVLAKGIINRKMVAWDQAEEKKRREAQRKADEEAQRKADEEAQRIAEEEQIARAEESDVDDIEEIMSEPVVAAPVVAAPVTVPDARPKVAGLTRRKNWKYRIVDVDKIPREYMMPDDRKLAAAAREMKENAKIPGIEVHAEESIASGRAW